MRIQSTRALLVAVAGVCGGVDDPQPDPLPGLAAEDVGVVGGAAVDEVERVDDVPVAHAAHPSPLAIKSND